MISIATWNINSIHARIETVTAWLRQHNPEMLLLQEIKCVTEAFPSDVFTALGYHSTVLGQPSYNGVAILSRRPVTLHSNSVLVGDSQARFLDVETAEGWRILNIYAPNGNPVGTEKFDYKLQWLQALCAAAEKLQQARTPFLIAGDFNIIPETLDARTPEQWHEDALFQPQSRQIWRRLCNSGLVDAYRALYPAQRDAYSFWDYQAGAWQRDNGIRIDHFLLSPALADRLHSARIDREPRGGTRPSDHTPVIVELDFLRR